MANNEDKKPDVLEDIKRIDRAVRAKTLAQVLSTLKAKAHEILELKEKTNALLEAAGVSAEDAKRIIDFVNSLDDVQLSDEEKRKLREDARNEIAGVKKQAEKKVNESPVVTSGYVNVPALTTTAGSETLGYGYYQSVGTWPHKENVGYSMSTSSVNLCSGSSSLAVKL